MYYKGKDLAMLFYKNGKKGDLIGITEVDQDNGKFFVTNGFMGVYLVEEEVKSFIDKWNSYASRKSISLEMFEKNRTVCLEHELLSDKPLSDSVLLKDIPKKEVRPTPFIDHNNSQMLYTDDFVVIADSLYVEFVKSIGIDKITTKELSALYFFQNNDLVGFVMPKSLSEENKDNLKKHLDNLQDKNIVNVRKEV